MHFIGLAGIHFLYTILPVSNFRSQKGYPLRSCHFYTDIRKHILFSFSGLSIDRKQITDITGMETKYGFSGTYYHSCFTSQ